MKKVLILLLFAFSFPIFSQNVETTDSTMINLWNSLSEEQRGIVIQAFLDSKLQSEPTPAVFDERAYRRGKRRLRNGIIFTSIGVGASALPFIALATDDIYGFLFTGMLFWPVGSGFTMAGIPILAVGAAQTARYRPQVAFAPNGINLSMRF